MKPVTDDDLALAWQDFWTDPERPHQVVPEMKPTDWLESSTVRALRRVIENDRARRSEVVNA